VEFTHRQILTILAGLMMGMFLAALDQTIMATATRTIADDLRGFDLQAWATTAFLITSTISTPLYGKLSDIYGRRGFFLFAIAIFVIGSMLCGLSQNMYELAAFRAVQGIGAGGLMSMALAIIGDIVPPRERPSTRASSWPSSAPRASSARCSAASSPARTRSSGSPAGAGSST
jgi:MFS family permease